jgi:hypothetical protein
VRVYDRGAMLAMVGWLCVLFVANSMAATTTTAAAATYNYDRATPNAQTTSAGVAYRPKGMAARPPTNSARRSGPPRFADFLAAEEGEMVSLSKAPASGRGASQFAEGYKPEDFPGNGAYFAREREIAESFAHHYGEGVIETRVPADVYGEHFAEHEMPYLGEPPGTELAIPPSKLNLLSQFPRFWHGQP